MFHQTIEVFRVREKLKLEKERLLRELESIESFYKYVYYYIHSFLLKKGFIFKEKHNFHRYQNANAHDVMNKLIKEVEVLVCDKYELKVSDSETLGEKELCDEVFYLGHIQYFNYELILLNKSN